MCLIICQTGDRTKRIPLFHKGNLADFAGCRERVTHVSEAAEAVACEGLVAVVSRDALPARGAGPSDASEAVAELYRMHRLGLLRLAVFLTDDRGLAEDLVQDAFAALRRLPRRQREVLVLRYWSALSEADIADTLAISRGTVKSTAARGLDALRRQLRQP
jgi:DNA-binding NarL/FixJ family response regulator